MEIKFKKMNKDAVAPTYSSSGAAGADLRACLDRTVWIAPGQTVFIQTGIAAAIPEGYAGFVFARSGLSCNKGLAPANKVGVIDSDYRGEIVVALHNHGLAPQAVSNGDRIAQMVIMPVVVCDYVQSDELPDTGRGMGGFGSTGR